MNKTHSNNVAVVTGANRGMGLGYVDYYLKKDLCVIATYKDSTKAKPLITYQKEYPDLLKIKKMDIVNEQSIIDFAQ